MTAPGYRQDEPTPAMVQAAIDTFGMQPSYEAMKRALRAAIAAAPQPEPPANSTFWAWLCNGKGDGWEEKDKVVHDPDLIKMRRERPDLWRIEGLYRAPAPGDDAKPEPPADLVEKARKWWGLSDYSSSAYNEYEQVLVIMASFAQEHAAAEKARADKAEKALADERVRADDAERLLGFIHTWIWRKDPPGATGKLTDAERLSVIKNHPWWNRIAAIRNRKGGGDE